MSTPLYVGLYLIVALVFILFIVIMRMQKCKKYECEGFGCGSGMYGKCLVECNGDSDCFGGKNPICNNNKKCSPSYRSDFDIDISNTACIYDLDCLQLSNDLGHTENIFSCANGLCGLPKDHTPQVCSDHSECSPYWCINNTCMNECQSNDGCQSGFECLENPTNNHSANTCAPK
jgi:hypothetical protein